MSVEGKSAVRSKEQIAAYVRDMAFLEEREFALRKAAQELRQNARNVRDSAEYHVKQKISEYRNCVMELEKWESSRKALGTYRDYDSYRPVEPQKPEYLDPPKRPACYRSFENEYVKAGKIEEVKEPSKLTVGEVIQSTILILLIEFFGVGIVPFGIACVMTLVGAMILAPLGLEGEKVLLVLLAISYGIILIVSILLIFSIAVIVGKWSYKKSMKCYEEYLRDKAEYICYRQELDAYNTAKADAERQYKEDCARYSYDMQVRNKNIASVDTHNRNFSETTKRIEQGLISVKNAAIEKAKHEFLVDCAKDKEQIFIEQAEVLEQKANQIAEKKMQLYSLGIVPPDYRTLDSLVMLDSIFRNDLADTMREAVLIYDERVFRNEVLRGIDRIYTMLGQLSSSMRALETRLIEVRTEVQKTHVELNTISTQLCDIENKQVEQYEAQLRRQDVARERQEETYRQMFNKLRSSETERREQHREMLQETRALRTATESVEDAARKCEWYMDQHRMGYI